MTFFHNFDCDEDRTGLLASTVLGHHAQDVAARLPGGERRRVGDHTALVHLEEAARAADAVTADFAKGGRTVAVGGLDLQDPGRELALLHLAAVLLLRPHRDVLVHVLNAHIDFSAVKVRFNGGLVKSIGKCWIYTSIF